MYGKKVKNLIFYFLIGCFFSYLTVGASFCAAAERLDKSRYITIDEIKPGMTGYCLTTYKGTKIEKFGLEILSVVRNVSPGRDAILVQGTDERFIHSGPVAGCSGSPVYIEGRLAGALAFGWLFSKDPLYGVTPIEDMLKVGRGGNDNGDDSGRLLFDFSKPLDFDEIDRQLRTPPHQQSLSLTGASNLPCPLIVSGAPTEICEQLNGLVESYGFMAVSGPGGGIANSEESQNVKLEPGASLAVPLVTGDITFTAIGTVTEVVDDKVYGFGHSFLGYGAVDLPMATGQIHTVVSNVMRSFKFGSALEVVGALRTDESAAIAGQIGAKAKMIPLTIRVDRYNDIETRTYNCRVATNRRFTPIVLRAAVAGAALRLGGLPPDHMVEYKVTINIEGAEPISFESVSTTLGLGELIKESTGPVAILMNNPYEKVEIKSIDIDLRLAAKNIVSHIWSVNLSDSAVKRGSEVQIEAVIESFLGGKKRYSTSLKVPDDLAAGEYNLVLMGGYGYRQFLVKTMPFRFVPQNITSLVEVINNILTIKKDKLYCVLVLPSSGVAIEKAELADLPATKALVLSDAKRTLRTQPFPHWLEKSLQTDSIVIDKKIMQIKVEE